MISWTEKQYRLEDLMPLITEALDNGRTVRFSPRGVSMLPMLRQGIDSVEFSSAPDKLKKFDLPLYRRDNGQFVLHRVVKVEETYTCIGDNQFVYEPGIRQEQILAVVTAFYRGNRLIKAQYLPYRLYCRMWHYSRPVRYLWRRSIDWLKRHIYH